MKKNKLSILSGTLIAGAIPIISVVSCGQADDPNELTLGMRLTDINAWSSIIDAFKAKTGINVSIRAVSDQKSSYGTWDGTDSLPDITLIDQNTAKYAMKSNMWFQQIDLNDIKSSDYDVVNTTPKEFDFKDESKYSGDKVLNGFYDKDTNHGGGDDKVIGIPFAYGSQGVYFNKLNLDFQKPLMAYVPKKDGTFVGVKVADNTTMEAISEFLTNSGKVSKNDTKSSITLNDQEIENQIKDLNSNSVWYDKGPLAMYQRLGSISKSLGKNNTPGWIKDVGLPFELIASLGGGIYDGSILNDEKLKEFFPTNGGAKSNDKEFTKLFQSYFGYFIKENLGGYATNPKAEGEPGEADAFWKGIGNTMLGYKWQSHMIRDNWYKKDSQKENDKFNSAISVIPAPYGSINIDALAITHGVSGEKLVNVKKFLRFALDETATRNAYNITLQKNISPIVSAANMQKEDITSSSKTPEEKTRLSAFFNSSKGETYNKVEGGIMAASTQGVYDIYNGKFGGDDDGLKGILSSGRRPKNYAEWKKAFDNVLPSIGNELAIGDLG